MREMSFLSQDYMLYQAHHGNPHHHNNNNNNNHHEFDDHHHHQDPLISLNILSSCPPQEFQDGAGVQTLAMLNRSMSFQGYQHEQDHHQEDIVRDHENNHESDQDHHHHHHGGGGGGGDQDDLSDDGSQVVLLGPGGGEKKKRLNIEQVKTLEKNFEQANKLEPERKTQLAKALGLQPRQVAIWFQNRRARWKTKQLEKDYTVLKRQFDNLKADNDSLLSQNKKLHAELVAIRNREPTEYGAINLNNVDTKSYWSNNGSEISSEMNLNSSRTPQTESPLHSNPSTKLQFSPNSFIPTNLTQLLHSSSSKPELDLQCTNKNDPQLQDENFCNIFIGGAGGGNGGGASGIENQPPAFWAWPEQQHLN